MKKANVFVIHPFNDQKEVMDCTDQICEKFKNFNIIILKNETDDWVDKAKEMIKGSELVLLFLPNSNKCTDNMKIERRIAEENNKKTIVIKNEDRPKCPAMLKNSLESSAEENLGVGALSDEDKDLLERQYRMLVDSAEALMNRRQTTGDRYATICCAILTIIGSLVVLNSLTSGITVMVAIILSVVGIFISWSWFKFIESCGKINKSKYRIIQILEKKLPAKIFYAEWEDMINPIGGGYTSYSKAEKNTPKIMMCLFLGVSLLCVFISLYSNWDSILAFFS